MNRIEKDFRLLNHCNEITQDLEIGKVYTLFKHWFITGGVKKHCWILSIGNTSKVFSADKINRYFKSEDVSDCERIVGYGRTYNL